MREFEGKIVMVTGGARGIGAAIVSRFAESGAKVIFTYSSSQAASDELCNGLRAAGASVLGVKADVRDSRAMAEAVEVIEREHGRIDVLVNNAGVVRDQLLMAMEDGEWNDVVQTNLTGAFHGIRPVARMMMRKRSGVIINISSIAATRPGRGHSNYAASKGGLESLTKALAVELAPKGVRVNGVAPGMIETDMSRAVRDAASDQILERIPLRRFGRASEIADAVLFLASSRATYITGTILNVDGGASV